MGSAVIHTQTEFTLSTITTAQSKQLLKHRAILMGF